MTTVEEMAATNQKASLGDRVLCGGILALIIAWAWWWPYSGDGDSAIHFLTAKLFMGNAEGIFSAWGRPIHKLLLSLPAQFGVFPTRIVCAVISAAAAWQTILLSRDLHLQNPRLAAIFLIFQPCVFALAGDTMTEMPMALGLLVALRLWINEQVRASALAVSFLPLLRPEGLFCLVIWGGLLCLRRRAWLCLLLPLGLLFWAAACWLVLGDAAHFLRTWWPYAGYASYGHGVFYDYAARWPFYCGPILLVLFAAGLGSMLKMRLVWVLWAVVFAAHSVMFWQGKFASAGLLRVLACVAPMTALICLCGWNSLAAWLSQWLSPPIRRGIAATAIALTMAWALVSYAMISEHYHCFGIRAQGDFLRQNGVLASRPPKVFTGDMAFLAEVGLTYKSPEVLMLGFDPKQLSQTLALLPVGSIAAWDDQQSQTWYKLTCDDLEDLGYTVIFDWSQKVPCLDYPRDVQELKRWPERPWMRPQRFVVMRKDQ